MRTKEWWDYWLKNNSEELLKPYTKEQLAEVSLHLVKGNGTQQVIDDSKSIVEYFYHSNYQAAITIIENIDTGEMTFKIDVKELAAREQLFVSYYKEDRLNRKSNDCEYGRGIHKCTNHK